MAKQALDLRQARVLLTGATGGIGQAIAHNLAEAGAQLLLCGRDENALRTLSGTLPRLASGREHQYVVADITDVAAQQRVALAAQALGGITHLINNAGISQFDLVAEQDFASQLSINLLAPMQLCQRLLPQLQAQPAAVIVNVGSAFGSIGYPGFSGYCASKFGLRGFTEALARELAASQVQVHYFAPRATQTSINSPEVVAMNQALGNAMDEPTWVAEQLRQQLLQAQRRRFLGWPEQLFVRLNALFPSLVDSALQSKLGIITQFAKAKQL